MCYDCLQTFWSECFVFIISIFFIQYLIEEPHWLPQKPPEMLKSQWNRSSDRSVLLYCDIHLSNVLSKNEKKKKTGQGLSLIHWLLDGGRSECVLGFKQTKLSLLLLSPSYVTREKSDVSLEHRVMTFWLNIIQKKCMDESFTISLITCI